MSTRENMIKEKGLLLKPVQDRQSTTRVVDNIKQSLSIKDKYAEELLEPTKRKQYYSALFLIAIPVVLAFIYNFMIASDRYQSTAAYVVRETKAKSSFINLLPTTNVLRSNDSSFAIAEYMQSRDAVNYLNSEGALERIFKGENVDMFSYFPSIVTGETTDDLFEHFQDYITVDFSIKTGITTLSVQAFSPEDAQFLVKRLLLSAEVLINELNERAYADSIKFAENVVLEANERLNDTQINLTTFRNTKDLLDPKLEIEIANQVMTEIMLGISKTNAKILEILSSSNNSSQIEQLKIKREALNNQLAEQRGRLVGSEGSLAEKIVEYEGLLLRREFAEKSLQNAYANLASSSQESQKNHLYIDQIVQPNSPDYHGYPQRYLNLFLVIFICSLLFWVVKSVTNLLNEEL